MEESEKRKERLKAIREQAAEAGDNNEEQNSIGEPLDHGLTNPLIETPSASSRKDEPRPRFDYYTDPMAAFSANNKMNNLSPQVSQPCNTPPSNYMFFLEVYVSFIPLYGCTSAEVIHNVWCYMHYFVDSCISCVSTGCLRGSLSC